MAQSSITAGRTKARPYIRTLASIVFFMFFGCRGGACSALFIYPQQKLTILKQLVRDAGFLLS